MQGHRLRVISRRPYCEANDYYFNDIFDLTERGSYHIRRQLRK